MTHEYHLIGMTCSGCEAKVTHQLLSIPGITSVSVSKDTQLASITMEKHVSLEKLQEAIGGSASKYQISDSNPTEINEPQTSWFETYKPILIIFGYILIVSIPVSISNSTFNFMQWMQYFMAGFFLIFSFFKMLNLSGFAESYSMYDVVAMRFKAWGFIYPFIELGLGLSYVFNFHPQITNIITFVVMSVSLIGVLQSVLNHKKIQCACLGVVFNLPMSTVTIIEDALMIGMSGVMLMVTV